MATDNKPDAPAEPAGDAGVLALARQICADAEGDNKGYQYLSGERDDYPTMVAVLAALRSRPASDVEAAGLFLVERLDEYWNELEDGQSFNQFNGSILPAMARFRAAIAALRDEKEN